MVEGDGDDGGGFGWLFGRLCWQRGDLDDRVVEVEAFWFWLEEWPWLLGVLFFCSVVILSLSCLIC